MLVAGVQRVYERANSIRLENCLRRNLTSPPSPPPSFCRVCDLLTIEIYSARVSNGADYCGLKRELLTV